MRVVVRVMVRGVVSSMMMGPMSRRLCEGRAHAQQHHDRRQANFVHWK
jgi:hypothetical protein